MDLNELQRTERRKVWIFVWLFFGFCLLAAVEVSDYNTPTETTELEDCLEVLQEHDLMEDDEQVEQCRQMILDIVKPSKTRVTT
jgi:hypothetical protein